jgi:hypothetical protein
MEADEEPQRDAERDAAGRADRKPPDAVLEIGGFEACRDALPF